MIYFKPIPQTLEELKRLYRKLSREHHPDVGGSEASMKIINSEYTELFKELKNIRISADGSKYHRETKETPEQLIILTNRLFKAQKWVDSAQDDYYEAECAMQNIDEYSFDVPWHFCYQAAQKYITSLLILKNVSIPKGSSLLDLVDICENHAKINLSFIYKECAEISEHSIQEHEYCGYYMEENDLNQILKNTEKVDFFVTSYLHEFFIGNNQEDTLLNSRKSLPLSKIKNDEI